MPELHAIPVTSGWSPTAYSVLALLITTWGVIVTAWIKQWGPWKKIKIEADEKFRDELIIREADLVKRIDALERQLSRQHVRHDAERAVDRHRLNNVTQCFDMLLMLIKTNPDKAGEVVTLVEEMRAKQIIAEAEEKAVIRAAEIIAEEQEFSNVHHV